MTSAQVLLSAILLGGLLLQAIVPGRRLVIVSSAAALACLVATLRGVSDTAKILAEVPWDVLVILVALGVVSEVLAQARAFDWLAVKVSDLSRGDARRLYLVLAVTMYVTSGLVNNLTALLLVLPMVLVLLRLMAPDRRYVRWTLGLLLVACNLGGAATPIGDFPAILMLSGGRLTFDRYLQFTLPATAIAIVVLLGVVRFAVRPAEAVPRDPVTLRLTRAIVTALHRGLVVERSLAVPALGSLGLMLAAWSLLPARLGVSPALVCWLGGGLTLLMARRRGETIARVATQGEALLFLLSLFVMVGAVRSAGLFESVARALLAIPASPQVQLTLFLVLAGLLTGVFSAGPGMAALLDVADVLAKRLPPHAVYVGLALAVCAGSSLFLTAATSGPLAQALTEAADLRDAQGKKLRFGFREFVPVGLVSFAVIEGVALVYAWIFAR